nr:MAG TPA: hypothetical protein [Caudoviricetes sp.]DAH77335.1 MAG TPA: hypothetical protein [Caudoviricetes sp.]
MFFYLLMWDVGDSVGQTSHTKTMRIYALFGVLWDCGTNSHIFLYRKAHIYFNNV